ncbi:MAG: C40 family peptidase [Terrimesophilobacter sp.]
MSSSKARNQIVKLAVIAVSGGLVATLALPAYAFNHGGDGAEASLRAPKEVAIQTVDAYSTMELAVSRDGYSATKPVAAIPAFVNPLVNRFITLNPPAQQYSGEAVVAFAMQFVGVVPYGFGNSPTTSFSCDGLTQYVFKNFGIDLPRMVHAQAALAVPISVADARPGDLLVYPGHIGIYAGAGMMIDSPRPGKYVSYRAIWGNPMYMRLKI